MKSRRDGISIESTSPPPSVFSELRAACGWGVISNRQATVALANSLFVASAIEGARVVGFGRVIGDAAVNYYIQDVVVAADRRGSGIGKALVSNLLGQIREAGVRRCTVGLMAAKGMEGLYESFGFVQRPSPMFGAGMTLEL